MAFVASCFGICRGRERSRGEEEEECGGQVQELPGIGSSGVSSSQTQQGGGNGAAPLRQEEGQEKPARPVSMSLEEPGWRQQAPTRPRLIVVNSNASSTSPTRGGKSNILSERSILWASQSEPAGAPPPQCITDQAGPGLLLSSNSINSISNLDSILPSKQPPPTLPTSTHPSPLGAESSRGRYRGHSIDLPRSPMGGLSRPSLRWQPPRQLQGANLVRPRVSLDRKGSLGNGMGIAAQDPPQSKTRAMLDFRMASLVAAQPSKYKCLQQHPGGCELGSPGPPRCAPAAGVSRAKSGVGAASLLSSGSGETIVFPTRTVSLSPSPNGILKLVKL